MGFTNRWVCRIKNLNFDIEKIKNLDGHYWKEEGEKHTLGRLIKLNPKIRTDDIGSIISGNFYFNWEQKIKDYEIKEDGKIDETTQIIRRTNTVHFWISSAARLILFPNSSDYVVEGAKTLSELFFGTEEGFDPITFDVSAIEKAANRGEFSMWTYYFNQRQGSIDKGVHYGDDIDTKDDLYRETASAPKNFIGIKMTVAGRIVKVRITKNGTVTFYSGSLDEPQLQPELFRAINPL